MGLSRIKSSEFMMGTGIVLVIVALIIMAFNIFTVPAPVPTKTPESTPTLSAFPYVAQMPEDIGRLESEVYKVCEQYASLDLSGMVNLCKRVGYQE